MRPADARLRARRLGRTADAPVRRRAGATAGPAPVRSSSTRRRSRPSATPSPTGPTSRSRTSHAGPATRSAPALAAVPDDAAEILVLSGDVPLITAADLVAVLDARREDDAAIALATVFAADPAGSGGSCAASSGPWSAIVEAKDATEDELAGNEINAGLYAFDAAWLRRRIGVLAPSPTTGELYLTELVRLAREDGRLVSAVGVRRRRPVRRHQRPLAARRRRVEPARPAQRGAHARRGHDARPVHGLPRLGRDARARTSPSSRTSSCAAATSVGEGSVDRGRQPAHRQRRSARDARVWASDRRVLDGRGRGRRRAVQPPPAGQRRRPRRGGRQLRRAQEHPPRRGLQAAPHELPRRRRDRRAASTSAPAPITANYDGPRKHRTTIGDGAFIGVDTMIVAPRDIGDGAKTGAGAVVTSDVPPGKLAVGVPARIREPRAKAPTMTPRPADAGARTRVGGRRRLDGHHHPAPRHRPPDAARGGLRRRPRSPSSRPPQPHRPARRRGQRAARSGSSAWSATRAGSWRSPRSA